MEHVSDWDRAVSQAVAHLENHEGDLARAQKAADRSGDVISTAQWSEAVTLFKEAA